MKEKIAVIGAGQMGSGIAQVFATFNYQVSLYDLTDNILKQGKEKIEKSLVRLEKKKLLPIPPDEIINNIIITTRLHDVKKGFDVIIEASTEDLDIKKSIFSSLSEDLDTKTIICTNTSSLPITKLAPFTNRPEQFIGMHFMNPVPVMKLVEVISGLRTSKETLQKVLDLAIKINKTCTISQDFPGFISNRILMPMINEAIFTLYEGVASKEDIDTTLKLGMSHPMGPLELADYIGLDTVLSILEILHDGFKDPKYRPCPLLIQKVQAGQFGLKTKEGFYKY